MVSNSEIRRLFGLYAELLLLHQQDERLAKWLSGAAYSLRSITTEVSGEPQSEIAKLFRPAITKLVKEIISTGTIADLDELIQLTPSGLFDMMRIKGLGGKKLAALWKTAKIDTIDGLLKACKNDQLISIPGFGAKTQANILEAIENYNANTDRFHYASVADDAEKLVNAIAKRLNVKASLCGEIRRQSTTIGSIEIIAAVGAKKIAAAALKGLVILQKSNPKLTKGHTLDEIPVLIYHSTKDDFYSALFARTGSEGHVKKVLTKGKFNSEEAIYKKAKLPFIVPEMREDNAEWNFIKSKGKLLEPGDIKGVVHNHTTYSDGVDTLEKFVLACKNKGYEYVVISDHSKNAHYAGGMKEEKILRQFKEINALNKKVTPFRIFKSIECDIRVSGELDYENSFLKKFDLVIVSIHQLLKMDEAMATKRLIKAIENPYTTILGHMTGRQLLIRPGYPVDFKKVIDACAANRVVIEINANPYRLDMDWPHIPYALSKGVMISVNPDAHSIGEIDNIRWGVSAARKGGLTKEMTWNAMSLAEIRKWLKQ
jgi:DNA polymerase (family 10)